MSIFRLPDLGEGLPEAEINQWHVKVGDYITADEPLVAMETAKAVVEVPSPQSGTIKKLHGKEGDIIQTGHPLVEFEMLDTQSESDQGTVVGSLETHEITIEELYRIPTQSSDTSATTTTSYKATPAVRALAKKLNVDLSGITPSQVNGVISIQDVEKASEASHTTIHPTALPQEIELLKGVRRSMAQAMSHSHSEVVPVTIFDEVDIEHWPEGSDITVRLIQAICHACQEEPSLNAWFDGKNLGRQLHQSVHLGIAMDTQEALFVPVIKDAQTLDATALRNKINLFKDTVKNRSIPQEELRGASITLSNFGNFAGRYATPIVVPPTVAILGVGKIRKVLTLNQDQQPTLHRVLPLSLSFDHRAVTGGEATRFLAVVMKKLSESTHSD